MSTPTTETAPSYFSFQPASYWDENDPLSAILRNVKGTNRRQMITDYWNAGKIEELEPTLLADNTNPRLRGFLESLHPSFMGGEYLPDLLLSEVEIARIDLQSTTADVISIRAKKEDGELHYSLADEYDEHESYLWPNSSKKPFSLKELIEFLDNSTQEIGYQGGLSLSYNNYNAEGGIDRESLEEFTTISSEIYPQLEEHYQHVFADWVAEEKEEMSL